MLSILNSLILRIHCRSYDTPVSMAEQKPIYMPPRGLRTRLDDFRDYINKKHQLNCNHTMISTTSPSLGSMISGCQYGNLLTSKHPSNQEKQFVMMLVSTNFPISLRMPGSTMPSRCFAAMTTPSPSSRSMN